MMMRPSTVCDGNKQAALAVQACSGGAAPTGSSLAQSYLATEVNLQGNNMKTAWMG